MKIAISSDNHLDVNQVPVNTALAFQAAWLKRRHIDYYLFAGDLFNDYLKTRAYFARLQKLVPQTKVYYILGNHDMLNHVNDGQIEHATEPGYLHNRFVDLPASDWRLIGNNGWYDYSFSSYYQQPATVASWKKVYWLDSSIDQPLTDQVRMERVLRQSRTLLDQAQYDHKKVLFLTHFVPRQELLMPKPAAIHTPRQERFYQMINAMLGSKRLGQLVEGYPNVKAVFYGHVHGSQPPLSRNGLTYFNQAVGVHKRHHNEWQAPTFADQWQQTVRVIELPASLRTS